MSTLLPPQASSQISALGGADRRVLSRLQQALARILYDFDSLSTATTRPFRSYARVQMVVEELVGCVLEQTAAFVGRGGGAGVTAEQQLGQYEDLLRRLNI
jgi:hypothetical protein